MPTHYKGTDEEIATLEAFIKLTRASESVNSRLNKHLNSEGITISQFGVLEALLHLGPQNQRCLGTKILKSGGNITLVIDNLEQRGLVRRTQDPADRRATIVELTREGESKISALFPKHLKRIVGLFDSLSGKEKKELARICKKLGLSV